MPGIEHILVNPFLRVTRGSARLTAALGTYTDNVLAAPGQPAGVAALYAAYHPVWAGFKVVHYDGKSGRGVQAGRVLELSQALRTLSDHHIKEWALAIEIAYRKGTPDYEVLLPRGRKPFRNGSKSERISAVSVLAQNLAGRPALAGLLAEVSAFAAQLKALDTTAGGTLNHVKLNSTALKEAQLALCHALYAVLGGLINIYPDSPGSVAAYFDVVAMHRHRHRKPAAYVEAEAPATVGMLQQEGATA